MAQASGSTSPVGHSDDGIGGESQRSSCVLRSTGVFGVSRELPRSGRRALSLAQLNLRQRVSVTRPPEVVALVGLA